MLIGIDDLDDPMTVEEGTGAVARKIANRVKKFGKIDGITRHQLVIHPKVKCTNRNASNVVHHSLKNPSRLLDVAEVAKEVVEQTMAPRSDPGIIVAKLPLPRSVQIFGMRAKVEVLKIREAEKLAGESEVIYYKVKTGHGLIGALAGVGLASIGNDGIFIEVGNVRRIKGEISVKEVLKAGVAEVLTPSGKTLRMEEVVDSGGWVRPRLIDGKPMLVVHKVEDKWKPLKLR